MYFFKKPKDPNYEEQLWIKDSTISKIDDNVSGFKNVFHLKNKYIDCKLACEKIQEAEKWIEILKAKSKFYSEKQDF